MLFDRLTHALNIGTQLNQKNPLRNGNMVCFPGGGELLVAGDLHNHQRNFERVQTAADLERKAIEETLTSVHGNREQAAKILGIGERTLYRKLKDYGIKE